MNEVDTMLQVHALILNKRAGQKICECVWKDVNHFTFLRLYQGMVVGQLKVCANLLCLGVIDEKEQRPIGNTTFRVYG